MSFIFIDTETTSLLAVEAADMADQPQILEIYCMKTDEYLMPINEFHAYCRPTIPIPEQSSKIHGITDDKVADALPFALHYKSLAKFFLGAERLIGHNLQFDKNVLSWSLRRINKQFNFPWPIQDICTIETVVKYKGHRMSLSDCHLEFIGESFAETHTAKADTQALHRIFREMVSREMIKL